MPTITPSLWFNGNLEEAIEFYTSVFPNSSIGTLARYTEAGPGRPGEVVSATFVRATSSSASTVDLNPRSGRRRRGVAV